MNIAFLGHGNVGGALAVHMQRLGNHVTLASRDPASASVAALRVRCPGLAVAVPDAAVRAADLVALAVPFDAHEQALTPLRQALAGKILLDCTNPVVPGLTHGLASAESGSERIQRLLPQTRVVKAFSVYGYENFEHPPAPAGGARPAMFFCGGDADAKAKVRTMLAAMGWDPLDAGGLDQAVHLEHMTLLWIKLVRVGGASAKTLWARVGG
ncbi:MAG: NADPH-dependent F420 reductase [Planctomycetota bacterium]